MCNEAEREYLINRNERNLREYEFYIECYESKLRDFKSMLDKISPEKKRN